MPDCRGWAIFLSQRLASTYMPPGTEVLAREGSGRRLEDVDFLCLYFLHFKCHPRVPVAFTSSTFIIFTRGELLLD